MTINVTKAYLPPLAEYTAYLEGIWERAWLTNNGPLVQRLESELSQYLDNIHVQFTGNGTIALQVAIKALGLSGEIITTPFSYVATTTAILWENCEPVFVDIEDRTFCIDAAKIEAAITPRTSAILATHVYGYPCDVLAIEAIARRHNLKVIYDGAHAFGVRVHGRSLLSYGDITTCSFHATKLFHTVEGGAIVMNDAFGKFSFVTNQRKQGGTGYPFVEDSLVVVGSIDQIHGKLVGRGCRFICEVEDGFNIKFHQFLTAYCP